MQCGWWWGKGSGNDATIKMIVCNCNTCSYIVFSGGFVVEWRKGENFTIFCKTCIALQLWGKGVKSLRIQIFVSVHVLKFMCVVKVYFCSLCK